MTFEICDRAQVPDAEWDELADRSNGSPFMRPGWFSAWRSAFGAGREQLATVRRGRRLMALAPLEHRSGWYRAPCNWHTPHFEPLAQDDSARAQLIDGLLSPRRQWRLSLWFVEGDSAATREFSAVAGERGWHLRSAPLESPPYLTIEGEWDAYEKRLPAKRRSNLRRLSRRLEEQGELSFEVVDGGEGLDRLLDDGFAVEASGWKAAAGTAIAATPDTRAFYAEVARWAAARGWLRLAFLRLDGRPLAFDYALEAGGAHYLLKTGYDTAYRSFAPGVLIRQRMVARAFETRLVSYEFLGQQAEWKQEWTDTCRDLRMLEAFPSSPAGHAAWVAWAYARPALNRARELVGR